jgi:hypothetical protein
MSREREKVIALRARAQGLFRVANRFSNMVHLLVDDPLRICAAAGRNRSGITIQDAFP